MIRFEGVSKRYGNNPPAVQDLNLTIDAGTITVLVGPSGCGKTTSLRMINRLEDVSDGRIEVNGTDVMATDPIQLRLGIGYVMQSSGLFPHRTIRDNIATVPKLLNWSRQRLDERVRELVRLVGLEEAHLDRYPHALSGGQQQRVGVARALAADPPVILMDEPFSAVDPVVRGRLQDEFADLQRRLGKTIVLVTHDIDEALKLGDMVAVFQEGGRLAQYAPPRELLARPAGGFVTDFIGADRELRRLALLDVGEAAVEAAPAIKRDGTAEGPSAADHGWAFVVDDAGKPVGWIAGAAAQGGAVAEESIAELPATVRPGDTMRGAANALVASPVGAVPRLDSDGRLNGMITQASIRQALN